MNSSARRIPALHLIPLFVVSHLFSRFHPTPVQIEDRVPVSHSRDSIDSLVPLDALDFPLWNIVDYQPRFVVLGFANDE